MQSITVPPAVYTEIRQVLAAYRRQSPAERKTWLLDNAFNLRRIPVHDPAFFTMSPFGWHRREFALLAQMRSSNLLAPTPHVPLRAACYGAGLHCESAVFRAAYPHTHPDQTPNIADNVLEGVIIAERACFGDSLQTCYEPREIIRTVLTGAQQDELHIYDVMPVVAEDLQKPELHLLTTTEFLHDYPLTYIESLMQYRRWICGDLSQVAYHLYGEMDGRQLMSATMLFSPEEMAKIRCHTQDLLDQPIQASAPYDLSIWLEGWYFLSPFGAILTLADIVYNTRVGGYILSDAVAPDDLRQALGLQAFIGVQADAGNTDAQRSILYRRGVDTGIPGRLRALKTES